MIKFPKGLTLFINNILQITRIKKKNYVHFAVNISTCIGEMIDRDI
jgi:hypothetical protein